MCNVHDPNQLLLLHSHEDDKVCIYQSLSKSATWVATFKRSLFFSYCERQYLPTYIIRSIGLDAVQGLKDKRICYFVIWKSIYKQYMFCKIYLDRYFIIFAYDNNIAIISNRFSKFAPNISAVDAAFCISVCGAFFLLIFVFVCYCIFAVCGTVWAVSKNYGDILSRSQDNNLYSHLFLYLYLQLTSE